MAIVRSVRTRLWDAVMHYVRMQVGGGWGVSLDAQNNYIEI